MIEAPAPIARAFARARAEGRPALIPFIVAGDPDLVTTRRIIDALVAAGADCLELGIPYSDPLADGPSIVSAGQRALEHSVSIDDVVELIPDVPIPVILFTYANPVVQYGVDRLGAAARRAGAAGMIVPELPLEETIPLARTLDSHGLEMPLLIAPTTSPARAARIAEASRGFLYLVSRLGVTGAGGQSLDTSTMRRQVVELRKLTRLPIAVGFGLARREHVDAVAEFADGAIVGSALIDALAAAGAECAPQAAFEFMSSLRPVAASE